MDKYDIVLDLIKHPAKYTPEKIEKILSDSETREIYNLLCKIDSAFASNDAEIDVDAEWQTFSKKHKKPKIQLIWNGSRAASIAAISFTSLAAVAIGITVAVKTFEPQPMPNEVADEPTTATNVTTTPPISKDSTEVIQIQEVAITNTPVLFEDTSLEEILSRVAEVHGATIEYKKPETARLHLYYKFDPDLPLRETVEQLNTFEQINIRLSGNKIIVD